MGRKALNKIKIEWSHKFSYAIGLIATDGNLSPDGRHIDLTSKDRDQLVVFMKCLGIKNKIGEKPSGFANHRITRIQFGDVNFYRFLVGIGLTPNKSKTLGILNVPDKYFYDFLRGCIDGDGSIGVHSHPESSHPQLKLRLCSASLIFLKWVKMKIAELSSLKGGWIQSSGGIFSLEYGKSDSIKVLRFIYHPGFEVCLTRKYKIAKAFIN